MLNFSEENLAQRNGKIQCAWFLQLMPNCLPKGQETYLVDLTLKERLFSC